MKRVIDVNTGEVRVSTKSAVLRSLAIGSCIAVVAYDAKRRIGAIAHVMLPGRAPEKALEKTKYAADAIEEMLGRMKKRSEEKERYNLQTEHRIDPQPAQGESRAGEKDGSGRHKTKRRFSGRRNGQGFLHRGRREGKAAI
ncbi:MAG: chemotaxis protein CheD [Planctomycetota bacterium]|jgi:hypothetical protein